MSELSQVVKIEKRIFTIRQVQVMLDRDLAELYGVETEVLNQAVKRNILIRSNSPLDLFLVPSPSRGRLGWGWGWSWQLAEIM